jgi:hypothetical protein
MVAPILKFVMRCEGLSSCPDNRGACNWEVEHTSLVLSPFSRWRRRLKEISRIPDILLFQQIKHRH